MDISNAIAGIEAKAAGNIRANEGDYIIDGLLFCGKCNTPKQVRVNILGIERTPMCLCRCESDRRDREEADRKRAEFNKRINEYRRDGFPESEMRDWTFENDDRANEKVSTVARKYVDNFKMMYDDGKGLILFGTVGTGKTYIAACIANALIDRGFPVMMTNFARIANTAQGLFEGRQSYFDSFNRFPLLIIDDLGAERKSEYMNEIVYNVVDSRIRAGLPIIVTSNLTADELKGASDISNQRIYSRLFESCIPIEVKGTDRRRERLKDDFNKYHDILGL